MKRLAFWCLVAYLAAQAFQQYVFAELSASGLDLVAWETTPQPLNRARAFVLLMSFVPLMIAFVVIGAQKVKTAPRRAVAAVVFLLVFCVFELAYRSVEFFVVDGMWTRTLLETSDPLQRSTMQERLSVFGDVVGGVYFPLMLTQLVGSLFLVAATFPLAGADWFLRVAMGVNALRLCARLVSTYGGVGWLAPFNDRLYFPSVVIVFGSLLFYIARTGDPFTEPRQAEERLNEKSATGARRR